MRTIDDMIQNEDVIQKRAEYFDDPYQTNSFPNTGDDSLQQQ